MTTMENLKEMHREQSAELKANGMKPQTFTQFLAYRQRLASMFETMDKQGFAAASKAQGV